MCFRLINVRFNIKSEEIQEISFIHSKFCYVEFLSQLFLVFRSIKTCPVISIKLSANLEC